MAKVSGNVAIGARHLGVEAPKVARQKVFIMHCHFHCFQVGLLVGRKLLKKEKTLKFPTKNYSTKFLDTSFSHSLAQHNSIVGKNIELGGINVSFWSIFHQVLACKEWRNTKYSNFFRSPIQKLTDSQWAFQHWAPSTRGFPGPCSHLLGLSRVFPRGSASHFRQSSCRGRPIWTGIWNASSHRGSLSFSNIRGTKKG